MSMVNNCFFFMLRWKQNLGLTYIYNLMDSLTSREQDGAPPVEALCHFLQTLQDLWAGLVVKETV